jgi:hypothetical protein
VSPWRLRRPLTALSRSRILAFGTAYFTTVHYAGNQISAAIPRECSNPGLLHDFDSRETIATVSGSLAAHLISLTDEIAD